MSYYQKHVFFCTNQREGERPCCQNANAQAMREYAKKKVKLLGLSGKNRIRINAAGCMDRCEQGPVIVVYPEGVWYTYKTTDDIDEIISEHLQQNRIVKRLLIKNISTIE